VETEAQVLHAARAGVVSTVALVIGSLLWFLGILIATYQILPDLSKGAVGAAFGLVGGSVLLVALAVFLGWRVYKVQSFWAALSILIWVVIETLGKFVYVAPLGALMFVAIALIPAIV
jgi:hypothetical protein